MIFHASMKIGAGPVRGGPGRPGIKQRAGTDCTGACPKARRPGHGQAKPTGGHAAGLAPTAKDQARRHGRFHPTGGRSADLERKSDELPRKHQRGGRSKWHLAVLVQEVSKLTGVTEDLDGG